MIQGAWWKGASGEEIAVSDWLATRMHLHVGSLMVLEAGGADHTLKVAATYRADGQHLGARVEFEVPSGLISNQTATWYGGVHIDPRRVSVMERAFFAAFPTITLINVADVMERIESVVDQITFVVRLLAGFSILAGLMILASSIASTRFRRMRETVSAQDAGRHADANCSHLQRGVQRAGVAGRRGGRGVCQCAHPDIATQA